MPQGGERRRHRRLAQQHFRLDTVSDHHPTQLRRTHIMMKALLESPQDFMLHIKTLAISIPLASMYGYDVASDLNDPFVTGTERVLEIADPLLSPLPTLVNIIPALRKLPAWLPGTTTQGLALEHRNIISKLKTEPLGILKEAVRKRTAASCVLSNFIEERSGKPGYEDEEAIITNLSLSIYADTSCTTISALGTLFCVLARHPEIQRKAQEEIDRVVGRDRLPDFQDRPLMPYTDALYHELVRWRPPAMLNIPHCVREDDHYKGYLIPKGSVVIANIWAMTRDKSVYTDPHTFKPERFLDEDGELIGDRRVLAYGFGRRLCVGKYVASSTLWIVIPSLLSCFNISKEKDESGREIEILDDYEDIGLVCEKKPFQCRITPRFGDVPKLIHEAVEMSSAA